MADADSNGNFKILKKEYPEGRILVEFPKSVVHCKKDPKEEISLEVKVLKDLRLMWLDVDILELCFTEYDIPYTHFLFFWNGFEDARAVLLVSAVT